MVHVSIPALTILLVLVGQASAQGIKGDSAILVLCNASDPNQSWNIRTGATWGDPNTLVANYARDPYAHCLDVADRDTGDNVAVRGWKCCCKGLPICGDCKDEVDNYNQDYILDSATSRVLTGVKMGKKCLVPSDNFPTVGSHIETLSCDFAMYSGGNYIVYSSEAPHLRLGSNSSLCLGTYADAPSPPPPPPPSIPQACLPGSNESSLPFCNMSLPLEDRVADLVQRMQLNEKVTQLIGGIGGGTTVGIPRLGVPQYQYHSEGLHGLRDSCKYKLYSNLFPQVTAMAATGNLTLINAMASHMGDEARAFNNFLKGETNSIGGGLNYWSPTINVGRDPRWGRFQESVSEDPWLNGAYAAQFVKGFQGANDGVPYVKAAACCKHFYAYSLENSDGFSRHTFNAIVSPRDLTETYHPAFAMCMGAQPEQIMCSYNEVNGVPTCLDGKAQNGYLRQDLGFGGLIVSDCDAIGDAYKSHHYVSSAAEATAKGILAGCDLDCGSTYQASNIMSALNSKLMNESDLDKALHNVFRMRFKLGMFDDPAKNKYKSISTGVMGAAPALTLQAAQEALVLLKNDKKMLPLADGVSVAIIGPTANDTQVLMGGKGDYCPQHIESLCEGLVNRSKGTVTCSASLNDESMQMAQDADVVFAAVGGVLSHEGNDRTAITLPADQITLINQLYKQYADKLVLVLVNGEPLALDDLPGISTIIQALEGGENAGTAFAQMVFGDFSPSGMLPFTMYQSNYVNKVNMTDMTMRPNAMGSPGKTYRFYTDTPTFPFAFTTTYTTWNFSFATMPPASASVETLRKGIVVDIKVSNTGNMDAQHPIPIFVKQLNNPTAPRKSLVGLAKVMVPKQSSVTVSVNTSEYPGSCAFCVVGLDGTTTIPVGGSFQVSVGNAMDDYVTPATIKVTA
eukprot:m.88967 g.88967  ORF g.88967 m.88967 type:complete len:909 (-) comp13199_c0_seq1:177-2903(-)